MYLNIRSDYIHEIDTGLCGNNNYTSSRYD